MPRSTESFVEVPVTNEFPLTSAQRAMLAATARSPVDPPYVLQLAVPLEQSVDELEWKRAWERVVNAEPMLRLQFSHRLTRENFVTGRVTVAPAINDSRWIGVDLVKADDFEQISNERLADIRRKSLNSEPNGTTPLVQSWWIQGPEGAIWCLLIHHAVLDGNSFAILARRVMAVYRDGTDSYPPVTRRFDDYARELRTADWSSAVRQFDDLGPEEHRGKDLRGNFHGATATADEDVVIRCQAPLSQSLRELIPAGRKPRLITLIHAAWAVLLGRFLEKPKAVFGVTRHCRRDPQLHDMIAPISNMIPLAIAVDDQQTIRELVESAQVAWQNLAEIETCPLSVLASSKVFASSGVPFETVVNVSRRSPADDVAAILGDVTNGRPTFTQHTDIPVALTMHYEPELTAYVTVSSASFRAEHACCLAQTFAQILTHIANTDWSTSVGSIPLLAPLESRPSSTSSSALDLLKQIETMVHRYGKAVALSDPDHCWTYDELGQRAGSYAAELEEQSIEREDIVAILTGRSFDTVAAILGTLRSGGAFFVVSEDLPAERIDDLVNRAGARFIVTDDDDQFVRHDGRIRIRPAVGRSLRRDVGFEPTALAYLVSTSGTTGTPRLVANEHRGLANLVSGYAAILRPTIGDARLQAASAGSDTFVLEVMLYLSHGSRLHLDADALQGSMPEFTARLTNAEITVVGLPSSVWREWAASFTDNASTAPPPQLRAVICSMERTCPVTLRQWRQGIGRDLLWINAYGPSEASCVATLFPLRPQDPTPEDEIPIGLPLPNTSIAIVDSQKRPLPNDVIGEIAIGGAGVGRGYLNDPDETSRKFLFDRGVGGEHGRLYLTGDVGYRESDGHVVFVGRRDHQIKIRGHRFELEELDVTLQSHPGITDAAAVAVQQDRLTHIVGFYVTDREIESEAIREFLARRLPRYALPHRLCRRDAIPRSSTGKVLRRKLEQEAAKFTTPSHSTIGLRKTDGAMSPDARDDQFCRLFGTVLCQPIADDEDFFQSGGDSLSAVRLLTELEARWNIRLTVTELLQNPTPNQLAEYCSSERLDRTNVLVPLRAGEGDPLLVFHGIAGTVFVYASLIQSLDATIPVWGVQSIEWGEQTPSKTLEAMSRRYATQIAERFGNRKVSLCGYSLGGILAFETSRHLHQMGVVVKDVIVLDTRPLNLPMLIHIRSTAAYLADRFWFHLRKLISVPHNERLMYLRERTLALRRMIAKGGAPRKRNESPSRETSILRHHMNLVERHQPTPAPHNVTLIRADREKRTPKPGWDYLSCGNLTTIDVACNHHQIMSGNIADVARVLNAIVLGHNDDVK